MHASCASNVSKELASQILVLVIIRILVHILVLVLVLIILSVSIISPSTITLSGELLQYIDSRTVAKIFEAMSPYSPVLVLVC